MKKRSSKSVFKLVAIAIVVALSVLTTLLLYWVWLQNEKARFLDLAHTATVLDRYYSLTFHQRELSLISVGERILDIKGDSADQKRLEFARNSLATYDDLLAFGLADTTGQLLTFTGAKENEPLPNLAASEATQRSFNATKLAKGIVIGEAYFFEQLNNWIVPIRVPIRHKDGKLRAVNTSAVNYHTMIENLKSFGFNPGYRIQFINLAFHSTQLYFPLAESSYAAFIGKPASFYSQVDTLQAEEPLLKKLVSFKGYNTAEMTKVMGVSTPPSELNHYLVVSVTTQILWDDFRQSFFIIMAAYFLLVTLTVFSLHHLQQKEQAYTLKLKAERDYITSIISKSSALIVGIDTSQKCTFINPAAERILGYSKEEIIGKDYWHTIYPGEAYQQVITLFAAIAHGPVKDYEMEAVCGNGQKRTISWNSATLYDEKGNISEIIGFGIDLTERKAAEKARQEGEANLASIFESTNSIIGQFDKQLHLVEFNQAFANYALLTDGLALYKGMPILDQMSRQQSDMFRQNLSQALAGEKHTKIIEYPFEQGLKYFMLTYNPIEQDQEITGVSMFVQDITDLKEAQNSLKQYSQELETLVADRTKEVEQVNHELLQSNEELKTTLHNLQQTQHQLLQSEKMASLGVLAAGVGHEINNPLNFIRGGVTALANQLNKQPDDLVNQFGPILSIINEGVSRASAIVKGLSHFSRQGEKQDEKCNLHHVLEHCLLMLQNKLKYKVEVSKEYCTTEPMVLGNEGKLHQVFLNILSNAEQAIPEKGTIKVKTHLHNQQIEVSITDSGTGIKEEHLSKISDPFFTTKPPGVGTGLGLAITYKIIEEHGGKVMVQSKEGEGTTFLIILPLLKG